MSDTSTQSNPQTVQSNNARTTPTREHLAWFLLQLRKHDKDARRAIPDRSKDQFLKALQDEKFYEGALGFWYKLGEKIRLIGLCHEFNVPSELPRKIFTSGAWAFAVHNLLMKTSNTLGRIFRQGGFSENTRGVLASQLSKLQVAWNSTEEVLSRWPESALVFDEKVQHEVEVWFRSRPASAALVAIPAIEQKPQLTVIDGLTDVEAQMRWDIKMVLVDAGLQSDKLENITSAVFRADGSTLREKLTTKAFGFRFQGDKQNSDDLKELAEILAKAAGLSPEQFDQKYAEDQEKRRQRKQTLKLRATAASIEQSDQETPPQLDIAEIEAALARSRKNLRRKGKK